MKPADLPGRKKKKKPPRTPLAASSPRGNSSPESARSCGGMAGEETAVIAAGRCAVPGGEGEGPCRDLPSPGHGRDELPELSRSSPGARRCLPGPFLGEGAALSPDLLLRLPPILLPRLKSQLKPLCRRSGMDPAGCGDEPSGAQRASVSPRWDTQQQRHVLTLAKHPEIQIQPIIPHPTPPSRAGEGSRGFYPALGIAAGAEPSPLCSQLVLLPSAP